MGDSTLADLQGHITYYESATVTFGRRSTTQKITDNPEISGIHNSYTLLAGSAKPYSLARIEAATPQADAGGRGVIVDSRSTDGRWYLRFCSLSREFGKYHKLTAII
ncbi:MAG: hypothetical protein WBA74_25260 [Cyclobacteriaceae bacterium]